VREYEEKLADLESKYHRKEEEWRVRMGEMQKKIFTNKDLSDITKTNSKSAIADLAGDDE
jgi:hypothetical protein